MHPSVPGSSPAPGKRRSPTMHRRATASSPSSRDRMRSPERISGADRCSARRWPSTPAPRHPGSEPRRASEEHICAPRPCTRRAPGPANNSSAPLALRWLPTRGPRYSSILAELFARIASSLQPEAEPAEIRAATTCTASTGVPTAETASRRGSSPVEDASGIPATATATATVAATTRQSTPMSMRKKCIFCMPSSCSQTLRPGPMSARNFSSLLIARSRRKNMPQ